MLQIQLLVLCWWVLFFGSSSLLPPIIIIIHFKTTIFTYFLIICKYVNTLSNILFHGTTLLVLHHHQSPVGIKVHPDVCDQQLRILVLLIADRAEERLVLLVVVEFVKMLHQHLLGDLQVAQWTRRQFLVLLRRLLWFVLLVVAQHVLVEVRLLAIRSLADVAPKRFLGTMYLHVHGQAGGLREGLVTFGALVGLLSCMDARVRAQAAWLGKGLAANGTLKRFIARVLLQVLH